MGSYKVRVQIPADLNVVSLHLLDQVPSRGVVGRSRVVFKQTRIHISDPDGVFGLGVRDNLLQLNLRSLTDK